MTEPMILSDETIEAAGRAAGYSLLAAGFAFPTEARLSDLRRRLLPAVSAIALPAHLIDDLEALSRHLPPDVESFRVDHVKIFPPIASRDAPGYETAYRGDDIFQQTDLLADIAGFYRAHGLRSGGAEHERPDHITVELEFMAVLARKTVTALATGQPDSAAICSDMGTLFLRDHLGCWAPAFGRRLATMTISHFYRHLGSLVAAWVEIDMASAGIVPTEEVTGPLSFEFEQPDDGMCGPCGTGGSS